MSSWIGRLGTKSSPPDRAGGRCRRQGRVRGVEPRSRAREETAVSCARAVVEAEVLHPAVVAAEELVAAVAGQQDLDSVLARGSGDAAGRDPGRDCRSDNRPIEPGLKLGRD